MENETELLDPRPLMLKRLIWDVFPHDTDLVREVQQKLGLVPDDIDGLDMGHDASDTRINRAAPLDGALRVMSQLVSEVVSLYVLAGLEHGGSEIPDDFQATFGEQNVYIIYEGVHAIICHLLDTGALAYGEKVSET